MSFLDAAPNPALQADGRVAPFAPSSARSLNARSFGGRRMDDRSSVAAKTPRRLSTVAPPERLLRTRNSLRCLSSPSPSSWPRLAGLSFSPGSGTAAARGDEGRRRAVAGGRVRRLRSQQRR
jgi:hypothetical protein